MSWSCEVILVERSDGSDLPKLTSVTTVEDGSTFSKPHRVILESEWTLEQNEAQTCPISTECISPIHSPRVDVSVTTEGALSRE